jgi:zinc knuckle protein
MPLWHASSYLVPHLTSYPPSEARQLHEEIHCEVVVVEENDYLRTNETQRTRRTTTAMSSTGRTVAFTRRETRRRSPLIIQPDEGVTDVIELTDADGLIEWIRSDPDVAWRVMIRRQDRINELEAEPVEIRDADTDRAASTNQAFTELTEKNTQLEEEIARLKEQNPTSDNHAVEEEYARIREERDAAIRERDGVLTTMRLMGTTLSRESPAPSTTGSKKSTKMPDPPMLSDGKDVKFKAWKTEMRRKLLLNEDHYPTAAHQLAYVSSRCEGKALRHINPRMQDDAATPYRTVQDVYDHLEGVFHDPNQKQAARDEYLALRMEPKKQDFTDFLAEFTYLAEEAEQPEELRKSDLYRKLPIPLQNQVMAEAGDNDVSFEKFVRKCQITARLVNQQFANRAANSSTGGNRGRTGNRNAVNTKGPSINAPTTMRIPRLTDKEKAALLREGKCFSCKESGHLSRDCLKMKESTGTTTVAGAGADEVDKMDERLIGLEDPNQGKV